MCKNTFQMTDCEHSDPHQDARRLTVFCAGVFPVYPARDQVLHVQNSAPSCKDKTHTTQNKINKQTSQTVKSLSFKEYIYIYIYYVCYVIKSHVDLQGDPIIQTQIQTSTNWPSNVFVLFSSLDYGHFYLHSIYFHFRSHNC